MIKAKHVLLVTGNKNKLAQFQAILAPVGVTLESANIDLPQLQGADTDIAKKKALKAFKQLCRPVIVEDTSLCYNAFKGLPGPYIKWFLDNIGPQGLHRMLQGFQDKSAYAQCIIGFMSQGLSQPLLFIGRTQGLIVKPRGDNKFGWDPIFQPAGYSQTYSEMSKDEKNKISHRSRAISKLLQWLSQ